MVGDRYGDDVPERLIRDLLRLDDRVLVGRMVDEWPDPSRALPLVERWRSRLAAGAEDEVADRWLALMRDADHARSQGTTSCTSRSSPLRRVGRGRRRVASPRDS